MAQILEQKIKDNNWELNENISIYNIKELVDSNKNLFENNGGDIETWLLYIKINHGTRIFGKHPKYRKKINSIDLEIGLENLKKIKNTNKYFLNIYI